MPPDVNPANSFGVKFTEFAVPTNDLVIEKPLAVWSCISTIIESVLLMLPELKLIVRGYVLLKLKGTIAGLIIGKPRVTGFMKHN